MHFGAKIDSRVNQCCQIFSGHNIPKRGKIPNVYIICIPWSFFSPKVLKIDIIVIITLTLTKFRRANLVAVSPSTRVTRLGVFSPFGRVSTIDSYRSGPFFGFFSSQDNLWNNFDKKYFGLHFGRFFSQAHLVALPATKTNAIRKR
jgi:hypothetical protein